MKCLVLHGFRANADILQKLFSPITKSLPNWEFTFINAPTRSKTGDPSLLQFFPQETNFFEWFNTNDDDKNNIKYNYFEESLEVIKSEVMKKNYDVLIGHSQGGLMALILTAMCERGMLKIPANKRWKYVVAFNPPFPRSQIKIEENESWSTPAMLIFGKKDKVVENKWKLKNAWVIEHEEAHNLPRVQASVKLVTESMEKLTNRVWFAFDFDGVICDSAKETGTSAWFACEGLLPGCDGKTRPSKEILDEFCKARPLLETGYEALVILYRLVYLKQTSASMLASITPAADMEDALLKIGCSIDELKERFHNAREKWLESNESAWIKENGFYHPTVEAMRSLITAGYSVYCITTKSSTFALKLLRAAGIDNLSEDRVFGLGSGKKRQILSDLAEKHEALLGGTGVFIEDRVETLIDVASLAKLPITLLLAGYGYNTESDRIRANENGFPVFSTSEELKIWIEQTTTCYSK